MKSNPSGTTTAYFSVHVRCPTVYHGQIVSTAICPTWCTYLYQEREKNRPPLENSSRSPFDWGEGLLLFLRIFLGRFTVILGHREGVGTINPSPHSRS